MLTFTTTKTPPQRAPRRVQRTHSAIEEAMRDAKGPLDGWAVLVGEKKRTSEAVAVGRGELAAHLEAQCRTKRGHVLPLLEIADQVLNAPAGRAPVVIATIEGFVHLQWLEAQP